MKHQVLYQNSIRAPFLTYVILCLIFFLIQSTAFYSSPIVFSSYSIVAPFILLMLIQQKSKFPFFLIPVTGFLVSSLLQSIIHPNSRFIVANGLLGAVVWSVTYLFAKWVMKQLAPVPVSDGNNTNTVSTMMELPKQTIDAEDISVSDLLMDKGHIGYYLTLDRVLGPGLSTRRGYSMFGGGSACQAPPNTIMTYPDYIPQIPCTQNKRDE